MKMKLLYVVFGYVSLGFMVLSFAAPPYLTDDPIPTDYRHSEFYFFGTGEKTKNETELNVPGIEDNYGLAPNLQFSIAFAVTTLRPRDEEEPNAAGLSDTQVGLKYQFVKESKCIPAMAFYPTYIFPTGNADRGLGNGRGWWFLPVWLQKSFGPWVTNAGGGYAINHAKEMKNFWFGGFLVQREVVKKLTLGAEIFSQGAESTSDKAFTVINVGAIYSFGKDVDLLFSIGNNILGARNFITYLGLGWEW